MQVVGLLVCLTFSCWPLETSETIALITLYSICSGLCTLKHVNPVVKCDSVEDGMFY